MADLGVKLLVASVQDDIDAAPGGLHQRQRGEPELLDPLRREERA